MKRQLKLDDEKSDYKIYKADKKKKLSLIFPVVMNITILLTLKVKSLDL